MLDYRMWDNRNKNASQQGILFEKCRRKYDINKLPLIPDHLTSLKSIFNSIYVGIKKSQTIAMRGNRELRILDYFGRNQINNSIIVIARDVERKMLPETIEIESSKAIYGCPCFVEFSKDRKTIINLQKVSIDLPELDLDLTSLKETFRERGVGVNLTDSSPILPVLFSSVQNHAPFVTTAGTRALIKIPPQDNLSKQCEIFEAFAQHLSPHKELDTYINREFEEHRVVSGSMIKSISEDISLLQQSLSSCRGTYSLLNYSEAGEHEISTQVFQKQFVFPYLDIQDKSDKLVLKDYALLGASKAFQALLQFKPVRYTESQAIQLGAVQAGLALTEQKLKHAEKYGLGRDKDIRFSE